MLAMAFNIESVPNQAGKPAILLRQAWREGKRIRKRTVANLSKFPPEIVEGFRAVERTDLPSPRCFLRIFAIVSTTSIL